MSFKSWFESRESFAV